MFLDSGEEFTAPTRIVIGQNDAPYINIRQGVTDWKRGKVIVPYHYKFASPVGRAVAGTRRDAQSVARSGEAPAIERRSGRFRWQPTKQVVYPLQGRPTGGCQGDDVWLGHLEKGYAIRKNGPARSPEK